LQTISGDETTVFLLSCAAMSLDTITHTASLRGPALLSHLIIRSFLQAGDHAVDATCGNGHDTLLLADLVGASGKVWAFDIQDSAIQETAQKLCAAGLTDRVKLIHTGHELMAEHVTANITAVVFNLGYRPGGDHSIITRPETTLAAFDQALQLLLPSGILAVTIYPGHDGGASESHSIDVWAAHLEPGAFHVWRMGQLNTPTNAPYFILIQKRA
jgi:predicted methyltransferase